MYEYQATLIKIIDGDTYDLDIDLGLRVYTRARVRLYGVDTPETYGVRRGSAEWQRGDAAKRFVEDWLGAHGPKLMVRTHRDQSGKYGRWLVEILDVPGKVKLTEALLEAGHARRVDW